MALATTLTSQQQTQVLKLLYSGQSLGQIAEALNPTGELKVGGNDVRYVAQNTSLPSGGLRQRIFDLLAVGHSVEDVTDLMREAGDPYRRASYVASVGQDQSLTPTPGIGQTGGSSGAAALTPTAVKSSAYTAAASDYVPVDASGGTLAVTLPTAPADGSRVGVKIVAQAGTPNAVTIARGGSDVFNKTGGSTSLTLTALFQGLVLQYAASSGIWYVQSLDAATGNAGGAASLGTDGKHKASEIPLNVASVVSGSRDRQSIWLPQQGYLSTWDAALAASGASLCEVAFLGDSTTYGQTPTGNSSFSANNHSLIQKLRALSIAAGYTDGGVGIRSLYDTASMNPVSNINAFQEEFSRSDASCGSTSGSNVITDAAILATDIGRKVGHSGLPSNGFVGSVTPGVSFTVVTVQGGAVALNATSTTTATATLTFDGFLAGGSGLGVNGPLANYDAAPANFTQTGFTTVLQFKEATCRLGYIKFSAGGGSFTYSVNGGGTTTIACTGAYTGPAFVALANPSPGTLCQVTITVTVAGSIDIWPEYVNAAGVVWHKEGVPSQKLVTRIPSSGTAVSLGATWDAALANGGLTNTPNTGPRSLKLAVLWMGLNDQSASSTQTLAEGNVQTAATAVGIFGQLCANAGIPGVVACPNFWSFSNALAYAPYFKETLYTAAKSAGVAWIDVAQAVLPVSQATTNGWTFNSVPHMNATGYDAVATYLWNNLLNPATGVR